MTKNAGRQSGRSRERENIGMIEPSQGLSFAEETCGGDSAGWVMGRDSLDRDIAVEEDVVGFVDGPHVPLTQCFPKFIAASEGEAGVV